MNKNSDQLQDGIDEMDATIDRLRDEIQRLTEQRDALKTREQDTRHVQPKRKRGRIRTM
jgi:TolA-binding protein